MNFGGVIHINKSGVCILFGVLCLLLYYTYSRNTDHITKHEIRKISLRTLLQVAIEATENGGKLVVAAKDNLEIKSKGKTKEGLEDSVTTADFLSHCEMTKILRNVFPTVKIISEESVSKCQANILENSLSTHEIDNLPDEIVNEKYITVWIDPLDATHEYAEQLYQYVTTMACIAVKGKPVIGIIHNPFKKETSWAWVNKAKSENLNNLEHKDNHGHLKVIISLSHKGQIMDVLNKNLKDFEVTTAAGAGYKVLQVAKGEADAYLHTTMIKKWDICAGNAILDALGGKMTTKLGNIIDYTDETNVKNEEGLIATMRNHDLFVGKL